MTDQEFETIALALKAAYPNANVLPDKYAMRTWYKALADLDSRVVENAVWEHINTAVWPPRISEIREKCVDRICPMITDWSEAWEEVQQSIRQFGTYRADEAIASLSPITAVAVRRLGFRNLCQSENAVADRAHFQRIYENLIVRERQQAQLPKWVQQERNMLINQETSKRIPVETNVALTSTEQQALSEPPTNMMAEVRRRIDGR